jgi:translocation and assembly module TamB
MVDRRNADLVIPGLAAGENPEPTIGLRSLDVGSGSQRRFVRNDRSWPLAVCGTFLALVLLTLGTFSLVAYAADEEKGVLASLISRALSTPATRVSIGSIEGALSSDATIRDIQISDRDGVWLRLDRARIVWRRLALLSRRLEIDRLEVGTLDVARRPIPAETPVEGENQPLLPELPVRVEIKEFALAELRLGEPILGTPARLGMTGAARLGNNPSEGLDLRFDARRLDAGGLFAVRFGLVPQGERLTLSLNLDEPEGGLLARAGNIPGLPPVRLDLNGDGTLDAFDSRLTFDAGQGIGARGGATVRREGPARRLGLDMTAEISGLLPEVAAPVFAGTTRLTGTASYADDGAVSIPGITLTAAAARLDIAGTMSTDQVADLRITAANLPNAATRTAVSGAEIRRLAFEARVTGPVTSPRVNATLNAEDARLPAGRLARLDATFAAIPSGTVMSAGTRINITADARATGLAPNDPGLARAVGTELTLALKGISAAENRLDVERLEIRTPTLSARYAGRLGSGEMRGQVEAGAADLSRFATLAGLSGLRGAATLKADVEGTPRANRYNAAIDARATRLGTGIDAVDGLFGGKLDAIGTVRLTPEGGFGFQEMRLSGDNAQARIDGLAAPDASNMTLAVTIPDLRRTDSRVSGRGAVTGQLTGPLASPDATLRIAVTDGAALGRPVPRLVVDVTGRDLVRSPDLRLVLDGEVDRKPARGRLHVARNPAGQITADEIDVAVGSVAVTGGVTLQPDWLANGKLAVAAGNLDDVAPLLLTRASGSLNADIGLVLTNGGQDATVKADGAKLSAFGASLDRVTADLRVTDLYRRPVISGDAAIDEVLVASERISRIRFNARGTPQASDVTLTATARGFDLDARARVVPAERTRIELTQFGASRGRDRLAIAGPATFTLADGGVDIRGLALGFGAGRLTVDGTAGSRLDLRVAARAVPLSAADIFAPGLGLSGTLEGDATIAGRASAPTGEYRARIARLSAPQTRNLGLPPIEVSASGRLNGERATVDATVAAGRAGQVRIGGSVPAGGAGALDLTIRGGIDAGAATTGLLAAAGRRLTGRVEVDARVGGTLASPQATGSATLAGGSFTDALQGTQLDNIRARAVARGEEIVLESASATTRNEGSLTASGRVRLDPDAGFPGDIRIEGRRAELVRSGIATLVANLGLQLSGPLARQPRVTGRVEVVTLDVTIPERLPATLGPLPNTRHVNPTRTTRARLALEARTKKGGRAAPPFDAVLDITLSAPGRIFVSGRGLIAELGGNLRLTGTLAKPVPVGAFELRSGRLQIVSSRLEFTRGRLTFSGDLTPELDFLAGTSAGGAAIEIAITGPANEPAFEFRSSPDLPRDEILSRLLFNSPSGQLTALQALSLAQAAAQYGGGGGDAFEDLRRSLGLQGLDVNLGASSGPGVGLNRALNDRISIGVRAGGTAASTGIGVDLRITDDIKLKGDVGSNGATSVGIGGDYEW